MIVRIPILPGVRDQRLSISLDGVRLRLRLRWNDVAEAWSLDVRDGDGEAIRLGMRLAPNWPVYPRCVDDRLPPGQIVPVRPSGRGPIGLNDLGDTVGLLYVGPENE